MMKTKLYMRLLLCLMMLGLSSGAFAQDSNNELLEENHKLAKELDAKEKEFKDSVKALAKIQDEIKAANKELQKLQQKNQNADLSQQIAALKAECDSLQQVFDSKQKTLSQTQADEKAKREQEMAELLAQQKKDSTMLSTLRSQVKSLTEFQDNWLSQIVEQTNQLLAIPNEDSDPSQLAAKIKELGESKTFDDEKGTVATAESKLQKKLVSCLTSQVSQWLDTPYSKIKVNDLDKTIKTLETYKSLDTSGNIEGAVKKLSNVKAEYDVYQEAVKALNSPYSSGVVSGVNERLKKTMPQVSNQTKREELSALTQQLSQYPDAVAKFKEIINDIENSPKLKVIISNRSFPKIVANVVKGEISKELEKRSEDIGLIKTIPWLSSQFETFTEKVTPENFSTVIETINNLK